MLFLHYLFVLTFYVFTLYFFLNKNMLLYWLIFNIPIIIIELIGYKNRNELTPLRDNDSLFLSPVKNINEFINKIWEEYGRIDNRYLDKNRHYVWNFELGNVLLILILLVVYFFNRQNQQNQIIRMLLILQIINCILYFVSYFYDIIKMDMNNEYKNKRIKQIIYLGISSIWIFFPLFLVR